jgi:membrane-associated phospholipid phosphatase
LAVVAGLLIVGSWHFVSDVLAGAFIGLTTGLLAAEVWLAHERSRTS